MEWILANWEKILVYVAVVNGIWNGLIAFLKVMGFPQVAAKCQQFEDALAAGIKAFIESKKGDTK